MGEKIKLSPYHIFIGGQIGVMRRSKSYQSITNSHRLDKIGNGWQYDCDGALGELAFAKWGNIFWDGSVNTFKSYPDVGIFEVRTTYHRKGHLILREGDKFDDTIYVLVLSCDFPVFEIVGWIYGKIGRKEKWKKVVDKHEKPAYFIPQHELKPLSELKKIIKSSKNT